MSKEENQILHVDLLYIAKLFKLYMGRCNKFFYNVKKDLELPQSN